MERERDNRNFKLNVLKNLVGNAPGYFGAAGAASSLAKGSRKYRKAEKLLLDAFSSVSGPINMSRSKKTNPSDLVAAPVSKGTVIRSRVPTILKNKRGSSQTVTHRELIEASVASHSGFTVEGSYPLNPGIAKTFPWLSTIASQYEQYAFRKLVFHFVPFVSTATAGTVMLMADYNAQDSVPTTEVQFMDHPRAVTNPLWNPISFVCDPASLHLFTPRRFVRNCLVAGDIKTFDCGNMFIATDNSATTPCGKLYVEYTVDLYTPQLEPSQALVPSQTSNYYKTGLQTFLKNTDTAVTFVKLFDPFNWVLASSAFTAPAGVYWIVCTLSFSDLTAETNNCMAWFAIDGVQYGDISYAVTTTANGYATVSLNHVIPLNGSQILRVIVNCTGAAGTLGVQTASLVASLA
jgi:hypothetical protein